MRIKKAIIAGFKGEYSTIEMGKVTLVSGKNRSGKTAIVSGIQAALCGNIDQIGSHNAKIGLLADKGSNKAEATVEMEDGWKATYSVKVGKSASAVRKVYHNDLEIDLEAAQRVLLGEAPISPPKLWAMSGEEMWSMMIKDAKQPEGLAASIQAAMSIDDRFVRESLQSCLDSINRCDSVSALGYVKDAASYLSKKVKECEASMAVEVPEYTGPSEIEVNSNLAAAKQLLDKHNENKTKAQVIAREIERLTQQIEQSQANITNKEKELESARQRYASIEATLTMVKELDKLDQINLDASKVGEVCDLVREKLSWLTGTTGVDHKEADQFLEACEFWSGEEIAKNMASPRMVMASMIKPQLEFLGLKGYSVTSIAANTDTIIRALQSRLDMKDQELNGLDLAIKSYAMQGSNIEEKRAEFAGLQASILPQDQVDSIIDTIEQMQAFRTTLQTIKNIQSAGEENAKKIGVITKYRDDVDSLVDGIQAWRKGMVDDTISTVTETANRLLAKIGMPNISITLVAGKRSSVTVEADGVNVLAMSGAEKTIYSIAMLHAIQELHGVTLPVIFVEGGELDQFMLDKVVRAADETPRCNLIVAHYLESMYLSPSFKTVQVKETVDA